MCVGVREKDRETAIAMWCDEYLVFSSLPRYVCTLSYWIHILLTTGETIHDKMKQYGKYGEMFQFHYTLNSFYLLPPPPLHPSSRSQKSFDFGIAWAQHFLYIKLWILVDGTSTYSYWCLSSWASVSLCRMRVYYILHIVYGRCASLLFFNSSFSISFYLLYAFCLSISLFDGRAAWWWWRNVWGVCVWLKWKISFIFSRAVKSCKMKTKCTFLFRCFTSETCKIGRAMLSAALLCFALPFLSFFFRKHACTQTDFWGSSISLFLYTSYYRSFPFLQLFAFISIYHCLDTYSHELARIRILWFYFHQHFTFSKILHLFMDLLCSRNCSQPNYMYECMCLCLSPLLCEAKSTDPLRCNTLYIIQTMS